MSVSLGYFAPSLSRTSAVCSPSRANAAAFELQTSNPSIERTSSGKAPWPRGALVHVAPRGQGASPTAAAHVKR
jgi:hypothetical protein